MVPVRTWTHTLISRANAAPIRPQDHGMTWKTGILKYSYLAVFKYSYQPHGLTFMCSHNNIKLQLYSCTWGLPPRRYTAALQHNWHGASTQSEKLKVWILPKAMLYTGLVTASSILKLCLHFTIISPNTVSTNTENNDIINNIFMKKVVFTNYGIF